MSQKCTTSAYGLINYKLISHKKNKELFISLSNTTDNIGRQEKSVSNTKLT